jgi:hypothetical protein
MHAAAEDDEQQVPIVQRYNAQELVSMALYVTLTWPILHNSYLFSLF